MPLRKRTRKIAAAFLSIIAVLVLLWLSMPLWLSLVLPAIGGRLNASYSRYERIGFSRFALHQVKYRDNTVEVIAERVEAPVPGRWLWRLAFQKDGVSASSVRVSNWQVSVLEGSTNAAARPSGGLERLPKTLRTIGKWIPLATLSNGKALIDKVEIRAPDLVWSNATVFGTAFVYGQGPITLNVQPAGASSYRAALDVEAAGLQSDVTVTFRARTIDFLSSGSWWSNRFDASASFAPGNSLPLALSLSATNLNIPASRLGLAQYADLSGAVTADWKTNAFVLNAVVRAVPKGDGLHLPPVEIRLNARGDTHSAIVQTATASSPWLNAELSRELEVHFQGPLLQQPAYLKFAADLAGQPWFKARGRISGEATFEPGPGKFPLAQFRIRGSQLNYDFLETRSLAAEGKFAWPSLGLASLQAVLEDGSNLGLSGSFDFEKRIATAGQARFQGPFLKRWLPVGYSYDSLQVAAEFSGPIAELQHKGSLQATNVLIPKVHPADLRFSWSGQQTNLQRFDVFAAGAGSSLSIGGSLTTLNVGVRAKLDSFNLQTNLQPALSLQEPVTIQARFGAQPEFSVSRFRLEGPAGRLEFAGDVTWPEKGAAKVLASKISGGLFSQFTTEQLPELSIDHLMVDLGWTNSAVSGAVELGASGHAPGEQWKQLPLALTFAASVAPGGLAVSNLVVTCQGSTVVNASGSLPVALFPGDTLNAVRLETNQPLDFIASAGPNAFFWQQIAELTRLKLRSPRADVRLSGTWLQLSGAINVRAEEINISSAGTNLPALNHLELQLELDREKARLTSAQVLVQGQRVSLVGELPLGSAVWSRLSRRQWPDWQTASAHLLIQDAEIAAFGPLFPNLLAPQGDFSAEIILRPGGALDGEISVAHARTRPLGATGPLRDIGVNIRLNNRGVQLRAAHASLAGATLTLSGQLDLSGTEWLHGEVPPFAVSLHGLNVPVARQPEYIVRSDLLLGVVKTNGAPPLITGTARLHDSYYLSDLRALIPGKVASPSLRPPYFSIDDPAVSDWRLAVDVQGARFMKLRSPLFNGEISCNVKLQGTLKDPIALGDVKIDAGLVRFPFANLQVQQGMVTLASQDPYHPQLLVRAASKQFGYDIRMDVSGPVDAPVIQFNSTPPLSSEQILLMVSAGELPQGMFNLTSQQRAQTVALFLGRDVLAKMGFGDQAEERLTMHSGEEISEQGRPTYSVEYKFSDRWSVVGEYDRFGDFNAGVKWRVYSK